MCSQISGLARSLPRNINRVVVMVRHFAQRAAESTVLVKLHAACLEGGGDVQHALQALAQCTVELLQRRLISYGGSVIKLLLRDYSMRSERSGAPKHFLHRSNVCGKDI